MVLKVIPDRCCLCNQILNVKNAAIVEEAKITIVHTVCLIRAKKIREYKRKIEKLNAEWEYYNECC
jgi:hypothetical protein